MIVTIIVIISTFIIYLLSIHFIKNWIHGKVVDANAGKDKEDFYKKHPSARQYAENEHNWNPSFNLEHRGLQVFNIPFVPQDKEIFYTEANRKKENDTLDLSSFLNCLVIIAICMNTGDDFSWADKVLFMLDKMFAEGGEQTMKKTGFTL